ncbi:MAG: hypothetical protein KAJ73_10050, partial [Zetaproteobacteria bacterium]|nr:hypothetical protein [Zetaproteobacteria bacterium]
MALTIDEFVKLNNEAWEEVMMDQGHPEFEQMQETIKKQAEEVAMEALNDYSNEELQAELDKRKKIEKAPAMRDILGINAPGYQADAASDFESLRTACRGYVEQVLDEHPEPDSN